MVTLPGYLKQPKSREIKNLDDPQTTVLYSKIIKEKVFLRNSYIDFYRTFKKSIGSNAGRMIESGMGSGGGLILEKQNEH